MKWFHRATLDRPGTDAAGGGIEWAYAANWTAKVEYAYFDFGKLDTTGVSTFAERETQSIDVTAHTVKIGVNYRWGAP